jgi:hypothetical protein
MLSTMWQDLFLCNAISVGPTLLILLYASVLITMEAITLLLKYNITSMSFINDKLLKYLGLKY